MPSERARFGACWAAVRTGSWIVFAIAIAAGTAGAQDLAQPSGSRPAGDEPRPAGDEPQPAGEASDSPSVATESPVPDGGEAATPPGNDENEVEDGGADAERVHPSAWVRWNTVIGNGAELDDASIGIEASIRSQGNVHRRIGWVASLVGVLGNYGGGNDAAITILDAIAQFELHEAFQVWVGRMLVPSDRSNFSGPWFQAPWNYPGFYIAGAPPIGPAQGAFGRNDGITAWGQLGGGRFKYYVGAFDLYDVTTSPLFTARVNVSLLAPEPGYFNSSTYYGKDILAIGAAAQIKRDGSVFIDPVTGEVQTDDYVSLNADILFEKNLGKAGVLDLEGAFHLFMGDHQPVRFHMFALASYLLPTEIGWGRLQPLVRMQLARDRAGENWLLIDAQVGYIIDQDAARLALGYQYGKIVDTRSNAIFLGIQLRQ